MCGETGSDFACSICEKNEGKILNKCGPPEGSYKYYNSIDTDEIFDLYEGISKYCEVNSELPETLEDYFILEVESSIGIAYDIIREDTCWTSNSGPGGCSDGEPYFNAWGMLIKNKKPNNNIALHVNHPLSDKYTLNISSYIFENLEAKWMIIAGAHRDARVDSSTAPECIDNFGADVARYQNSNGNDYTTPFQIFHEVISSDTNCTNGNEELLSLSIHGFDKENLNTITSSFIISNGNADDFERQNYCMPPDPITSTIYHELVDKLSTDEDYIETCDNELVAIIVQKEIGCETNPYTVSCGDTLYSPYSQFSAYSNPQGRYTNNTDEINNFTEDDTWIHIEIESCIRNNYDLYKKTASIISDAINFCYIEDQCRPCDNEQPCSESDLLYDSDCSCIVEVDCESICGGLAVFDECGVCSGNGIPEDCNSCVGDLNGDGELNVLDVVILALCVLAGDCSDLEYGCSGDLNEDGVFNVLDVVILVNNILNP